MRYPTGRKRHTRNVGVRRGLVTALSTKFPWRIHRNSHRGPSMPQRSMMMGIQRSVEGSDTSAMSITNPRVASRTAQHAVRTSSEPPQRWGQAGDSDPHSSSVLDTFFSPFQVGPETKGDTSPSPAVSGNFTKNNGLALAKLSKVCFVQ